MPWKRKILVVANQTVGSGKLREELRDRSAQGPTAVTLLLPHRPSSIAEDRLRVALAELQEDGLEAEGRLANPDPFLAVDEAWGPALYDEILISTLPSAKSRWLKADLPNRIARHTGAIVSVVSGNPQAEDSAPSRFEPVAVIASLSQAGDVITLQRASDPFTAADVEAVLAALSQRRQAA